MAFQIYILVFSIYSFCYAHYITFYIILIDSIILIILTKSKTDEAPSRANGWAFNLYRSLYRRNR